VVVEGYPIARRQPNIPGIDLPLGMMAELTETRYLSRFAGKSLFKGFSTMLVPTATYDNLVTWHLLHNEDGSRISYLRSTTKTTIPITISQLERSRHVLGWCPQVSFHAGAPDAPYTIKGSRLPRASAASGLSSAVLSMGHIITGYSPISIGIKDQAVHVSRCYYRKLNWLRRKFVVLWDEEDKRGWLVNGTSALLHLIRASLCHDQSDGFDVTLVLPGVSKEVPYKPHSALQVLRDPKNLERPIYPEIGSHNNLQDLVEYFSDVLEKMLDHQQQVSARSRNLPPVSRACFEGWDFVDLIKERDPIYPRSSVLDAYGKSWVDLTRSINAVTLLGRGFGEIIQPIDTCGRWATLPKGMSYLAVCQEDLEEIMEADGDTSSSPVRLVHGLCWFIPTPFAAACQCLTAGDPVHSDLAQVMVPASICQNLPSGNLNMCPAGGAFFFGYNSVHQWYWGDTGDPFQGPVTAVSPQTRKRTLSPSGDSGIGTSLGSHSSREHQARDFTDAFTPSTESLDTSVDLSVKRVCTRSISGQLTAQSYTVGIICALNIELMAVRALLDPAPEDVPVPDGDPNYYCFGCVGKHRVVASCLPDGEYGTVPAAEVVSHMKRSFPNVKFCLLVGIGGGVPSDRHDIRLGDVVVSTPSGSSSGIIPYDVKKTLTGGEVRPNTHLPGPPRHLRSALSKIKSDPKFRDTPPLKDALQQLPQELAVLFQAPESSSDRLFNAAFAHPAPDDMCGDCCPVSQEVLRSPRMSTQPRVHYGAIASGNQLMKDGLERDKLAKQHNILCFETEAAGIMHTIPSLVIRGICDYADSHKSKTWQRYASATAAAYARFLLLRVRASQETATF
jgi:nucleoside phosphorylase